MDTHALQVLEFPKIRRMVRGHIASDLGGELCDALAPTADREAALRGLQETTEAKRLYDQGESMPLDGLHDIRPALRRAAIPGAVLEETELLKVAATLSAIRRTQSLLADIDADLTLLRARGANLAPAEDVENSIRSAIDEAGEVRDSASRELQSIRRSLREERGRLVSQLENIVRHADYADMVQDEYVTFREGRYVIPVQAKYKTKVKGILHGRSDSGTTVFIEPLETIAQGNRLRELEAEEKVEVRRILAELSGRVRLIAPETETSIEIMARLDLAWAKARTSARYRMNAPIMTEGRDLELHQARHPLLLANKERTPEGEVVPLDLEIDEHTDAVVITGPNTGGKTVALKTVGLCCLMAHAGLHIPAEADSRVPWLSGVYADIGDEQSIEQSLSTFSSHLSNIIRILDTATPDSLVLLDELGAGTDPLEGGALGQAILEGLLEKGAMTLVTTHLNDLKVFAHVTDRVANAAMEFDTATLSPTFRLVIGNPGTSNALAIARRLGMPESVLEKAGRAIHKEGEDAVGILRRLAEDADRARTEYHRHRAEADRAERMRQELERQIAAIEKDRRQEVRRARDEARGHLRELEERVRMWTRRMEKAERNWQLLMEEAREKGALPDASPTKEAAHLSNQMRGAVKGLEREAREKLPDQEKVPVQPVDPAELRAGMRVKIAGLGEPGQIVTIDDDRKNAVLLVRNAELRVPVSRIEGVVEKKVREKAFATSHISTQARESVSNELDIHGLRVEEGAEALDRYLDDAYLAGLQEVTIIHGIGTGALKGMVRDVLKGSRIVKSYREGGYYEGGSGVTVVTLAG